MGFISDDIAGFVRSLKKESGKAIWLVGSSQVNAAMPNEGLIDEMLLTIFPLMLGGDIPLFAPGAMQSFFKTMGCETSETGLIQWLLAKG